MLDRRFITRVWTVGTYVYLAAYLAWLGYTSHWTFKGAVSPLEEIGAAPMLLSATGLGIYTGSIWWYGNSVNRARHPVSFWIVTAVIAAMGLFFLVTGLQDLMSGPVTDR